MPHVTNSGLERITAALAALSWWMQAGTGSGATTAATDVITPVESRALCVAPQGTVNVANDFIFIAGTIIAAADAAVTEFGVFDDAVAGNICLYVDNIGPFSMRPGDSVVLMIDFTVV